jgi:hypothetical protein
MIPDAVRVRHRQAIIDLHHAPPEVAAVPT